MSMGLTPASRRRLLGGIALLGAGPGAAGTAAPLDGPLLAAAAAFCDVELRMLSLFEGPGRVEDDRARDLLLGPLRDEQRPHLDLLCRQRARSLAGHRARAIAFALWDDGDLADKAEEGDFLGERLLAALVRVLAVPPS